MSYCTITDVTSLVPQFPFTSQTTPTQAQVQQFIIDISTIIDATLGNMGYLVPVPLTATKSQIILSRMCSSGALGLALQVRVTAVSPDQLITNIFSSLAQTQLRRMSTPWRHRVVLLYPCWQLCTVTVTLFVHHFLVQTSFFDRHFFVLYIINPLTIP